MIEVVDGFACLTIRQLPASGGFSADRRASPNSLFRPPLMLRLPIGVGSSLVDRGFRDRLSLGRASLNRYFSCFLSFLSFFYSCLLAFSEALV